MKKLVFAICMLFAAAIAVNAQDTTSTQSPTDPASTTPALTQDDQDGRVKIKSQDLPDAVKKSLEGQEYRGWLVNAAYKVDSSMDTNTDDNADDPSSTSTTDPNTGSVNATKDSNASEIFIVELKNGAQTKTVRFDKDGKKLDDEGMNDDQKKK